jgi:hypothetical protein
MLIFLDIDGVMVSGATWKVPEFLEDGFPVFTQKSVRSLNSILSPETQVILSTSHRDRYTIDQWRKIFARRGLHVKNLDRLPPSIGVSKRKEEILNWFSTHNKPKEFLIIDDDKSLYDLPKKLKEHLIITSPLVGLTQEKLEELGVSPLTTIDEAG